MKYLYHSTSEQAAQKIELNGFRDASFGGVADGVFFSNRPLTHADGVATFAHVCFQLSLPDDVNIEEFEVIEDGRPEEAYREWLIPAEIANHWHREIFNDDEA